jgi:hypothetical protein
VASTVADSAMILMIAAAMAGSRYSFPHQQCADRSLDQAHAPCARRHGIAVEIARNGVRGREMAYVVLPAVRSRTMRVTTSSGVDLVRSHVSGVAFGRHEH